MEGQWEVAIVAWLARAAIRVVFREALVAGVWGDAPGASNAVEVTVAHVRATLGAEHELRTVRGVGYLLDRRDVNPSVHVPALEAGGFMMRDVVLIRVQHDC